MQSASISNDAVEFNGRFGGIPKRVMVPIKYILGIYAKENGQGMIFESDELPDPPNPPEEPLNFRKKGSQDKRPAKPSLKIVK